MTIELKLSKEDAVRVFMSIDLTIAGLSNHIVTCPDPTDPQFQAGLRGCEGEVFALKALKKQVEVALACEAPRIVLAH
jgi:hypothetical protein